MIHHIFANRSNIGDWLSAKAIQSMLGPAPIKEHLIDEPFVEDTLRELSEARDGDLAIIGGGGLFMDYFLPFWSGFFELAERLPFCIWGVGCCDHKTRPSHPPTDLLRKIAQRARICAVRDELTRKFLGDDIAATIAPCPSVTLIAPTAAGDALLHAVHYGLIGEEAGYERWAERVQSLAQQLRLPYLETNNEIEPDSETALADELKLYARARIVISSRLHGCIIGLGMGKKVIAVSGDWKVESFMHAAGLDGWICDARDAAALGELLAAIDQQPAATDFMEEARRCNREIASRVRSLI